MLRSAAKETLFLMPYTLTGFTRDTAVEYAKRKIYNVSSCNLALNSRKPLPACSIEVFISCIVN